MTAVMVTVNVVNVGGTGEPGGTTSQPSSGQITLILFDNSLRPEFHVFDHELAGKWFPLVPRFPHSAWASSPKMQSAPDRQAGGAPCTYRVAWLQQIG
jgi:hypothetical protein